MALLKQDEMLTLTKAVIDSGFDVAGNRAALFQLIHPAFRASIPVVAAPNAQLLLDLGKLIQAERFSNGDVPLETWLRNLLLLVSGFEKEEKLVREMLSRVTQRASGGPPIDPTGLTETKERIIHTDDTVTFAFMEAGVRAAVSVAKLLVPRYDDGQPKISQGRPMRYAGTGWLLTGGLMMTNHHVINARNDGEPGAKEADFKRQASKTEARFDFDADGVDGTVVPVQSVEAWKADLDYAIVRITPVARAPLRRAADAIKKQPTDAVPVNIIQHPGGRSKRYGIRNNLVTASSDTELRYFTDTEGGSSGSPVFNDNWEVVALHRASTYVQNVQFQGKPAAYVNLGTHLTSIMADIAARYPALAAEIAG